MSTQRNITIDVVRGTMVLLVVFFHACFAMGDRCPSIYTGINWAIAVVRMPLLMLVSGYLVSKYAYDISRLLKRVYTLAWVYILWGLLYALFQTQGFSIWTFLAPDTPLWFIGALIVFTVVLMINVSQKWLVIGSAALAMVFYSKIVAVNMSFDKTIKVAVFFFIGVFYRSLIDSFNNQSVQRNMFFLLPIWVVAHIMNALAVEYMGWQVFALLERIVACGTVFTILRLIPPYAATLFAYFGRNTLPIFVSHVMFVYPMLPILGFINPYILPFVLFVIAVSGSLAAYRLSKAIGLGFIYEAPMAIFNNKKTAVG